MTIWFDSVLIAYRVLLAFLFIQIKLAFIHLNRRGPLKICELIRLYLKLIVLSKFRISQN